METTLQIQRPPRNSYDMQIYIHREDEDFGPYSEETAREYIKTGVFHAADHGWHEGMTEWQPVGEILGLEAEKESTPVFAVSAPKVPTPTLKTFTPSPVQAAWQPRRPVKSSTKKGSGLIALNLVLIVLAGAGAYLKFGNGRAVAEQYWPSLQAHLGDAVASTTQAASQAASAVQADAARLTPSAAATAATEPAKTFTPEQIATNPSAWPKAVMLKTAAVFPAVYNSQVIGTVTVPEGTLVHFVGIKGNQVQLEYRGGGKMLPWNLTDLDQRVPRA